MATETEHWNIYIYGNTQFSIDCDITDFAFLLYARFEGQYGERAQTALPYAMNSEFSRVLAVQMVSITYQFSIVLIKFIGFLNLLLIPY